MAITTQAGTVMTTVDPLSLHKGIEVVSGNAVQTYNNETKEYEPDRTLAPLILMPYVEAADPEGVQGGRQTLTAVEWYDGVPAKDFSNRITDGTDYEVGDGTVQGFPKDALKVKRNVPADEPAQVFCVAKFDDRRTGGTVRVEMGVKLYTAVYESRNYKVELDCPSSWTVNPLEEDTWTHTLTAQLYSGKEAVADANAAYWWEVKGEGDAGFRAPTEEELEAWLTCKGADGNFTRTLTFDARMMKSARFRVRAAYYDGDRPGTATDETIQAETFVNVEITKSLTVDQLLTKGARVASDFSTKVGYKIAAYDNRRNVGTDKIDELMQVRWKAKSGKPGSGTVDLDSGRELEFVPKDRGFDKAYPVAVYSEVSVYEKHKVLTDADGKWVTDAGGKVVIVPVFE